MQRAGAIEHHAGLRWSEAPSRQVRTTPALSQITLLFRHCGFLPSYTIPSLRLSYTVQKQLNNAAKIRFFIFVSSLQFVSFTETLCNLRIKHNLKKNFCKLSIFHLCFHLGFFPSKRQLSHQITQQDVQNFLSFSQKRIHIFVTIGRYYPSGYYYNFVILFKKCHTL